MTVIFCKMKIQKLDMTPAVFVDKSIFNDHSVSEESAERN